MQLVLIFLICFRYVEACQKGYNFDLNKAQPGTGHFSQVVWKDTNLLGMGKAVTKKDGVTCTYFVARYKKPGNVLGKYVPNVPKGTFAVGNCGKYQDMINGVSDRVNSQARSNTCVPNLFIKGNLDNVFTKLFYSDYF